MGDSNTVMNLPRVVRTWLAQLRQRRQELARARFYASTPCPPSSAEPWLGPNQRRHSKAGRL